MRRALPGDIATLVALMAEFYAESDGPTSRSTSTPTPRRRRLRRPLDAG
jgi:hypothetical protein